jgi:hypothetical protein
MFLPDKVNFQTDCPDPPPDISSPNCYAQKSTEKDALITELYMSIDFALHPRMQTNAFYNQVCTNLYLVEISLAHEASRSLELECSKLNHHSSMGYVQWQVAYSTC